MSAGKSSKSVTSGKKRSIRHGKSQSRTPPLISLMNGTANASFNPLDSVNTPNIFSANPAYELNERSRLSIKSGGSKSGSKSR
jgi:hypothetical protein